MTELPITTKQAVRVSVVFALLIIDGRLGRSSRGPDLASQQSQLNPWRVK
jgi:hypothetical protein